MAYVPVPKDLSKVKTKVAFNLTKRQIVCFAAALLFGFAVSSCFLLQSLIPPFQVFSAVLRRNKSCLSCMVVLWGL